jgi:hypothetical protein
MEDALLQLKEKEYSYKKHPSRVYRKLRLHSYGEM